MHLEVLLLEALVTFQGFRSHTWLPQWTVETFIVLVAGSLAEQHRSGQWNLESSSEFDPNRPTQVTCCQPRVLPLPVCLQDFLYVRNTALCPCTCLPGNEASTGGLSSWSDPCLSPVRTLPGPRGPSASGHSAPCGLRCRRVTARLLQGRQTEHCVPCTETPETLSGLPICLPKRDVSVCLRGGSSLCKPLSWSLA